MSPDLNATLPPSDEPPTLPPSGETRATDPADSLLPPGYECLGELGRGGMGVVYRARQTAAGRTVALKVLLSGNHASAADFARFRAEAEAIARLSHPGVVQIHEVGDADGRPFFSLEFCPGGSLDKRLAGEPQPPGAAAELVEKIARAVHAAHTAGVVHRDLKPANVLIAADGSPKVTDFGIAKKLDAAEQLTATGAIMGTPSYMAPEQAGGESKHVGPAADVWSLGAILYECLTGRPPFRAATPLDTILQVVGTDPVAPSRLNAQVPRDLETIALKCLNKSADRRYATAAELADDLRRWSAGEPIRARPAGAIERGVKWVKRRPAAAVTLFGGSVAIGLFVAGLAVSYWQVRSALQREQQATADAAEALKRETAAKEAIAQALDREQAAQTETAAALKRERENGYAQTMLLAERH